MEYQEFIRSKQRSIEPMGFEVDKDRLNPMLHDWQRSTVHWSLRRGRAALFEECGLGKTPQQLVWAEEVHRHTQMPVVIHCPVGVSQQTKEESEKFNIGCRVEVVNDSSEIVDGINLVNYEKIHRFHGVKWGGVVPDESSILKSMNGKTRNLLCDTYRDTPFKLCCTATPAPNDNMELGNHAEFLGVCDASDMLNRFFYHDSGETSKWVLMPHGEKDFWGWMASWAVCISKPSDIGGDDTGYNLPELDVRRHYVAVDEQLHSDGWLFRSAGMSATTIHEEKRITNEARCRKAADLARAANGPVIVWCDTNYEADLLAKLIPGAVEVRGSMKSEVKESRLAGFTHGEFNVLITKSTIAGFGMNWQHCRNQVFAGLSYSFEQFYQAVRRSWRFGQLEPVTVDIVLAETESGLNSAIASKEAAFRMMQSGMAEAMREATLEQLFGREGKVKYTATGKPRIPSFLTGAV